MWIATLLGCGEYSLHSGGDRDDLPGDVQVVAVDEVSCVGPMAPRGPVGPRCPDPDSPLEIERVWTWWGAVSSMVGLSVGPIIDGDDDGEITRRDPPSLVVGAVVDAGGQCVALSGVDGRVIWRSEPFGMFGNVAPVLGDLDRDGRVEVAIAGPSYAGATGFVTMLDGVDGAIRWRQELDHESYRPPAAFDLDGDSHAEIGVAGWVFSAGDGGLVFPGAPSRGAVERYSAFLSFGADLTGDGVAELVLGRHAYGPEGEIVLDPPGIAESDAVVADFDGDGWPDVVYVHADQMWGSDRHGAGVWGPIMLDGRCVASLPGPVAVEDLDRDGRPEIVVACRGTLGVYRWGGERVWTQPIDDNSTAAGPAIADLDGDGWPEVAFGGETAIQVFSGRTGALRWEEPRNSGTAIETPVFADIDLDGRVEMLIASEMEGRLEGEIRAYRAVPAGPGRPIWNSHSYHIGDVADDMTITAGEPYWLTTNSFRSAGLNPILPMSDPFPELLDVCEERCGVGRVVVYGDVANGGSEVIEAGLEVVLRAGLDGAVVSRQFTTAPIAGGGRSELLIFDVPARALGAAPPTLEVDPAGRRAQCLAEDDDVVVWREAVCDG